MEKEEIIAFLENRLTGLKEDEPTAVVPIAAYERVISDLLQED